MQGMLENWMSGRRPRELRSFEGLTLCRVGTRLLSSLVAGAFVGVGVAATMVLSVRVARWCSNPSVARLCGRGVWFSLGSP